MKPTLHGAFFFVVGISIVVTLLFTSMCFAGGQVREVVLRDGSVIVAEVVSYKKGVYTLRSKTMGELQLQDSEIQAIRIPENRVSETYGSGSRKTPQSAPTEDITKMQQSMLTNPDLIGLIFSLQEDPEVQKVLQDQEIMALITSGDVNILESNPKFIKLMENPKIRAIVNQMTGK